MSTFRNCGLSPIVHRVVAPLAVLGAAILALTVTPTRAGQYVLEKGKGVEVCKAYEKNLNSLKPTTPFRSGRPVNRENSDFRKPTFEPWFYDPKLEKTMLETEKKILRFIWERDVNPASIFQSSARDWKGTSEQVEAAYRQFSSVHLGQMAYAIKEDVTVPEGSHIGRTYLSPMIGRANIDNDGKPEYIHLFSDGGDSSSSLLVLNDTATDLDREKTKFTLQHPSRKEQGLGELRKLGPNEFASPEVKEFGLKVTEDAAHGINYGIFTYKDKTYFDQWWITHPDYQGRLDFEPDVAKPLRVFVIENKKTREVCSYKFRPEDKQ